MARDVVAELQRQGYEVYEEVSTGYGGKRADLVGVRGVVTIVVECKSSLSLKLLDQLTCWRGYANLIVGAFGGGRIGNAANAFCRTTGIGLWSIVSGVNEKIPPTFHRRKWDGLKDALHPAQRSQEYARAGSRDGGYWTPFRQTCDALLVIVNGHPNGIDLRDALRQVKHHYASQSSAVSSLPGLVRGGHVKGIRVTDGRPLRLYPEGVAGGGTSLFVDAVDPHAGGTTE